MQHFLFLHAKERASYRGPKKWMPPGCMTWDLQIGLFKVNEAYLLLKSKFPLFEYARRSTIVFLDAEERAFLHCSPKVNATSNANSLES